MFYQASVNQSTQLYVLPTKEKRYTRHYQHQRSVPSPFNLFGAEEIRAVLKQRAHCLEAGFPLDHPLIVTFDEIRDQYIERVGYLTYLRQISKPHG